MRVKFPIQRRAGAVKLLTLGRVVI